MTDDASRPVAAVEMRGITKRFGAVGDPLVVANDAVDLTVAEGEIHAVVGENGAGKSTLMHILAGLQVPDRGAVHLFGEPLPPGDPTAPNGRGIGLVAQHFALVPTLTVWENVILGAEPGTPFRLDADAAREEVQRLSEDLGVHLPADEPVEGLPVATQQAAEIIKALYRKARVLILDEPTAALSPPESRRLYQIVQRLRASGTTVLLVTHRIQDVLDHATGATVLRQGRCVRRFDRDELNATDLIESIVGEAGAPEERSTPASGSRQGHGRTLLAVTDLTVDDGGELGLSGINLRVDEREILGIAGVAGNGQADLVRALIGDTIPIGGTVSLDGVVLPQGIARRRAAGLSLIPEDRLTEGLISSFPLRDNLVLGNHSRFSTFTGLRYEAIDAHASALMSSFDVRASGTLQPAAHLSGGNQQIAIIARELDREPRVVVAVQPTRGLDIKAAAFVRQQLTQVAASGRGVLLLSHDLDELMALSHRIAVISRGRIVGELDRNEFTEAALGRLMTGA